MNCAAKSVYLDYNATTPLEDQVYEIMVETMRKSWANPSSNYDLGFEVKKTIERSRCQVGEMIKSNHPLEEITFTSGGTEANNWIIYSCLQDFRKHHSERINVAHVITSNIEHDSISLPLRALSDSSEPEIEVTFVPVNKETGTIDPEVVMASIKPNTILITLILANNETGYIQDVKTIAKLLVSVNKRRSELGQNRVYLHTDAAQAIGKISVDVEELAVDYLTIVGHKFYAPRIGALYHRRCCPLFPLFFGGGQESNLRPGTENTPAIAGMGKAAELVRNNLDAYSKHLRRIRLYLEEKLMHAFPSLVQINGLNKVDRLPNTVSVTFQNNKLKGSLILKRAKRIRASVGAACHSTQGEPSSVLVASGIPAPLAECTLRLSVGRETEEDDIDIAVGELHAVVVSLLNSGKDITVL